jgi:segregation and condensation protein B
MNPPLEHILEAALLVAGEPLDLERMRRLFEESEQPDKTELRRALDELADLYQGRGIELVEVAGGWRIQVRQSHATWVGRLWEEKAGRYSRALLETLALIAYRQPITRAEIAEVRGVTISTGIVRTLQERGWVKVIGHREVPGRPALFGTTREFLDYFNLRSLGELPPLAEIADLDALGAALEQPPPANDDAPGEADD